MPYLRKVSGEKCVKILCNKLGFSISGRSGSHVRLSKQTQEGKVGTEEQFQNALAYNRQQIKREGLAKLIRALP